MGRMCNGARRGMIMAGIARLQLPQAILQGRDHGEGTFLSARPRLASPVLGRDARLVGPASIALQVHPVHGAVLVLLGPSLDDGVPLVPRMLVHGGY